MQGLMLHCGASAVNRGVIASITPPPPMGPNHNPIPYGDTLDQLEEELGHAGLRFVDQSYGMTKGGDRMFGLIEVAPDDQLVDGEYIQKGEYNLLVGVRGSYDQSFPRGFAVGARVFVCDNLSFSGEVVVKTKQTTNINKRMPVLIANAVQKIMHMGEVQEARFDAYKNFAINDSTANDLIIEMLRGHIAGPILTKRIVQQWYEPEPEEHAEAKNIWRLHNAVTEVIKPSRGTSNVIAQTTTTIAMTKLFDRHIGFLSRGQQLEQLQEELLEAA